jgi:hypothetical protein
MTKLESIYEQHLERRVAQLSGCSQSHYVLAASLKRILQTPYFQRSLEVILDFLLQVTSVPPSRGDHGPLQEDTRDRSVRI